MAKLKRGYWMYEGVSHRETSCVSLFQNPNGAVRNLSSTKVANSSTREQPSRRCRQVAAPGRIRMRNWQGVVIS
jgi:hypothetical protein